MTRSDPSKLRPVQYTGLLNVSVTVDDPTSPAADTIVGAVVSGAVAVAVRVCGALTTRPSLSRIAAPPIAVSVTATDEPGGGELMSTTFALVTPLSPVALHTMRLSATSSKVPPTPLTVISQSSGDQDAAGRQTCLLKVTVARFPKTLTPV